MPGAPNDDGTELTVTLPNDAAAQAALAPGQWSLTLRLLPAGEANERETNAVALVIAPALVIAADAPTFAARGDRAAQDCAAARHRHPVLAAAGTAAAAREPVLGTAEATAKPRSAATDPLVFDFPATLPAGAYPARLRIDGVDSLLLDLSGDAPAFDASQTLSVPP